MEIQTLNAVAREGRGKGAARQARREGKIPAVVYGRDTDTVAVTIDPAELREQLAGSFGRNAILSLEVDGGGTYEVMLQDYQKDPVSRAILHADFYVIARDRTVDIRVPIRLTGRARGVAMGGRLRQIRREVIVRCLPSDIPEAVTFDVSPLRITERALVDQIEPPANCELIYKNKFAFAQVNQPKAKLPKEGAEGEAVEGEAEKEAAVTEAEV